MGANKSYGCLMAYVNPSSALQLVEHGKKIIKDDILYFAPDDDYGRETTPHVTIKYGFSTDLTSDEQNKFLVDLHPFTVQIESISIFDSEKFDVVKFDITISPILKRLREMADKFPNEDKHPIYHPHMTLAYVKKGSFDKKSQVLFSVGIDKLVYSPAATDDKKSFVLR